MPKNRNTSERLYRKVLGHIWDTLEEHSEGQTRLIKAAAGSIHLCSTAELQNFNALYEEAMKDEN
jgi:hypothetical protein